MHLPKRFLVPGRFPIVGGRRISTKAVVAIVAFAGSLFSGIALAGQGPSQWCSDNVGNEQHILNSPVTLNTEAGGPVGPQGWSWIVCFSPTAWGDGSPAPTGGAGWFGSTQGTSGGNTWVGCGSDANSTVLQFGCNNQVGIGVQTNPIYPLVGLTSSNSIVMPGVAGVQTGCNYGYTAGTGGIGCGTGGPSTRPSQNCADNIGNQQAILHDPATLDFDVGGSPGSYNFVQTCYSTSPYQSSTNQVTGGLISIDVPSASGQGTWCASDPAAMARLDCSQGTSLNTSNPTSPSASTSAGGQVTVLGNPVPISGKSAGIAVGCTSGTVAISITDCANAQNVGISGTGNASGGTLAASGTGCADGDDNPEGVAISGTGCAWGDLAGISGLGSSWGVIAVGGSGCSNGQVLGVNATGCATSWLAGISGTGDASASGYSVAGEISPHGIAASGTNGATGKNVAVSGTGCAGGNNSMGIYASTYCASGGLFGIGAFGSSGGQIAASGTSASGGLVAISPGSATGGSVLNASGSDRRVAVLGIGVPYACEYGFSVGIGVGCGGGGSAGRPSQWCADGYSGGGIESPRLIHEPATLDLEQGDSYLQTCYSTGGYSGGGVQATGGALVLYHPVLGDSGAGPGIGCHPDSSAMVQLSCQVGTYLPGENPLETVLGYSFGAGVTALGTPVSAPGSQAQAGTGCASGIVAISTSNCANGGVLGISGLGGASGNGYSYNVVTVPGSSASGTGCTTGSGGVAVSGTCGATGTLVGIGGAGTGVGTVAVGGYDGWGGLLGVGNHGASGSALAAATYGCASSSTVAISGTNCANGGQVAASATGCAYGTVAVGPLCGAPVVGDPLGVVAVGPTYSNNPSAAVAVANGGTANGSVLGASTSGQANSPLVAANGFGGASGTQLAVSGTGCTGGNDPNTGISISGTGCASAGLAGISGTGSTSGLTSASGTGCSTGWYLGISGTGCAYSTLLAVSPTGPANAWGNSTQLSGIPNGFGISGTNSAYGWLLGLSGTGSASGVNAVSGAGDSNANGNAIYPGVAPGVSLSGIGDAYGGTLAISGLGMASSNPGGLASVAVAGGKAVGRDLALSGTSDAEGTVAISGTGSSKGTVAVSPVDSAEGSLVGVSALRGATGVAAVGNENLALQIKFRVEFGLVPDASIVQALIANPPSNNSRTEFGAILTNAEYAEMQRRETVGAQAYLVHNDGLATAPNEYSGSYIDHLDGGKIKVGFTGNLSQHLSRIQGFFPYPDQVRVVQMQFTYNYLEALQNTIENSIGLLRSNGLTLVATAIDEELNKVLVGVAAMSSAQANFLSSMFGPAAMLREMPFPEPAQGRTSVWSPARGGIKITSTHPSYKNNAMECTLGFISGDWAITAAHCATGEKVGGSDIAQNWWQPCPPKFCPNPGRKSAINVSGQATRIRYRDRTDAAAFQLKSGLSSNYVYINEREPARQISGYERWDEDRKGRVTCKAGIATGYPPCGKLQYRDVRYSLDGMSFRSFRVASTCTAQGDSGGPVLYAGKAKGITKGSWHDGDCPEGQNWVLYSHIDHVLSALGLSL